MNIQPWHDNARALGIRYWRKIRAARLKVQTRESVAAVESHANVVDRHGLFAQRHVVVRQGVMGRGVQVVEQVDDQPLAVLRSAASPCVCTHIGASTATGGASPAAQSIACSSASR